MDYVFIDTSVFEANNFFAGSKINGILKLAQDEHIKIILPLITVNEIKNRAYLNIKTAIDKITSNKVIKNIASINGLITQIDREAVYVEFDLMMEQRLKTAKCLLLEYPKETRSVFEKYFKNEFPFGKADKKQEFPDAFAILTIELWCKENNSKCYMLSRDNDLILYKSEYFTHENFDAFLDSKLRNIKELIKKTRLKRINELYEKNKDILEKEIEEWAYDQAIDAYYCIYPDNDVDEIEVETVQASLSDFKLNSITDHFIILESDVKISLEIPYKFVNDNDIESDLESHRIRKENIVTDKYIPVTFKVNIPIAGDKYMGIEIDDINNGKDLKLYLGD